MANRLLNLLKDNKEALTRFEKVKSKEDALSIAKTYISGYTEAELLRDIQEMQDKASSEGALNADQLESVVGGAFNWGGFISQMLPLVVGVAGAGISAYQQSKNPGTPPQ